MGWCNWEFEFQPRPRVNTIDASASGGELATVKGDENGIVLFPAVLFPSPFSIRTSFIAFVILLAVNTYARVKLSRALQINYSRYYMRQLRQNFGSLFKKLMIPSKKKTIFCFV